MNTRPLFVWAATLGFVLATLVDASRAAGPRYTITQLRPIVNSVAAYASGTSIDDNGVVVGQQHDFNTGTKPVVWSAATVASALPLPTGITTNGMPLKISKVGGQIGGQLNTGGGPSHDLPVRYSEAGSSVVTPPSGSLFHFLDINSSGQMLIQSDVGFSLVGPTSSVTLDTTGLLGITATTNSFGGAVTDAGEVFVTARTPAGSRPFRLFADRAPEPLAGAVIGASLFDANEAGLAVGRAGVNSSQAALFENGTTKLLTNSGGVGVTALLNAVNDRGRYVGQSNTGLLVGEGGGLESLNSLIDGASGWTFSEMLGINNRGQIIGIGNYALSPTSFKRSGFRLDPIRTPGDLNYDNSVNFDDLIVLAQNYNRSGDGRVFWETGDFNFDWTVNFDDLIILAQNYNKQAAFAGDWAFAQSLVPEPVMTCGLLGLPLIGRRRTGGSIL